MCFFFLFYVPEPRVIRHESHVIVMISMTKNGRVISDPLYIFFWYHVKGLDSLVYFLF